MGWIDKLKGIVSKPQVSQSHPKGPPDPRFLGKFLGANLLTINFKLDDAQIDRFVADLPSELRDVTKFWIRIYLAWVFKVYTHKQYGADFTETMMAQVREDMTKAGTITETLKDLGPSITFWFAKLDDATAHIGKKVNDQEIPFEVFAAMPFLALDAGSPFFRRSDTNMVECDVAAALTLAKDEAFPFIQRAVDFGGPSE